MDEVIETNLDKTPLDTEARKAPDKADGCNVSQLEFRERLSQQLRTPLNAMMGFAELLAMQPGSAGNDDSVQHILRAGHELLDVINRELGDARDPTASAQRTKARSRSPHNVLYIEDDAVNFKLVEQILESRPSLELMHATNAITGLQLARTHRPELILLDLNLPDLHGSEVLQRLQQESATARIPVVVISADATPSQIERLLTTGARNYLTKPIGIQNFLAVVDELVDTASAPA